MPAFWASGLQDLRQYLPTAGAAWSGVLGGRKAEQTNAQPLAVRGRARPPPSAPPSCEDLLGHS